MSQSRFPPRRRRPDNRRLTADRLGGLIRHVRTKLGWSIREAAAHLGINRSTIQRAETASGHYVGAAVETLQALFLHLYAPSGRHGITVRFDFAPELQSEIDAYLEPERSPDRTAICTMLDELGFDYDSDPDRIYILTKNGRVDVDLDDRDAVAFTDRARPRKAIPPVAGESPSEFAARVHNLIQSIDT